MLNWDDLVQRRNAWVDHNFPPKDDEVPGQLSIFGIIEEVGELAHSHLKEMQNIRGSAEEHQANAKDAIGDITVYLLGVMNAHGATPNPIELPLYYRIDNAGDALFAIDAIAADLSHYEVAKRSSGADYTEIISHLVVALQAYCTHRGWDYQELVMSTWEAVETRDWISYPDTGRPPGHGTSQELTGLDDDKAHNPASDFDLVPVPTAYVHDEEQFAKVEGSGGPRPTLQCKFCKRAPHTGECRVEDQ